MADGDDLTTATREARRRCADGDLAGAHAVLRDALARSGGERSGPGYASAARLHGTVLARLGEPHAARGWAATGFSACHAAYGPAHPQTLAAASTFAAVLHTLRELDLAEDMYAQLAAALSRLDGPGSRQALAARADLATVRHARGACDAARELLAAAYREHRIGYGAADPHTIKMAARLGRMLRDCGDFLGAHQYLDLARTACREHLPPDDPLVAQVATVVHAAADPRHVCGARVADRPDELAAVGGSRQPPGTAGVVPHRIVEPAVRMASVDSPAVAPDPPGRARRAYRRLGRNRLRTVLALMLVAGVTTAATVSVLALLADATSR